MKIKSILILCLLVFSLGAQSSAASILISLPERISSAEKFYRTELYFGLNKPGGVVITNEEWSKFLEDEVTPRFPEGFTVLEGYGQFKNKSGKIVKESSKVLIVLYPKKAFAEADRKINEIRTAYNKAFQQQSVLRMDIVQTVRVSF